MARMYYYNGSLVTWQYLHDNIGYTLSASLEITYLSADPSDWGEATSDTGYYDGNQNIPMSGEFFVEGQVGWLGANDLASTAGLIPDECEVSDIYFENNGTISPGAKLHVTAHESPDNPQTPRYLIASAVNLGWNTLDEWADLGWTPYTPTPIQYLPIGGVLTSNSGTEELIDIPVPLIH